MGSRMWMGIGLATLMMGCGEPEVASDWTDTPMRVDGELDDWAGRLQVQEDLELDFGVANDGEYLYLALAPLDQTWQRNLAMRGLEIWVGRGQEQTRSTGVRYPVGLERPEGVSPRAAGQAPDFPELQERFAASLDEVDLLRPGGEVRRAVGELTVVQAAGASRAGGFAIELRIPLADLGSEPGLGVGAGERVALNLRCPMPELPAGRAPGGREMGRAGGSRTGGPAGGGRPGGRAGGRPGGMIGGRPELPSLDVWIEVQLAGSQDLALERNES